MLLQSTHKRASKTVLTGELELHQGFRWWQEENRGCSLVPHTIVIIQVKLLMSSIQWSDSLILILEFPQIITLRKWCRSESDTLFPESVEEEKQEEEDNWHEIHVKMIYQSSRCVSTVASQQTRAGTCNLHRFLPTLQRRAADASILKGKLLCYSSNEINLQ